MLNITVEDNEEIRYMMSVALEAGSLKMEGLVEGVEAFGECLRVIGRYGKKEEKEGEVMGESVGAWGRNAPDSIEGVLKATLGKECRVIQYKYDAISYQGEEYQL